MSIFAQETPTAPGSGGGDDAPAGNQGMSEDDLFKHLTAYYERFAPGTRTEEQLKKMAGKVAIVSAIPRALPRARSLSPYLHPLTLSPSLPVASNRAVASACAFNTPRDRLTARCHRSRMVGGDAANCSPCRHTEIEPREWIGRMLWRSRVWPSGPGDSCAIARFSLNLADPHSPIATPTHPLITAP